MEKIPPLFGENGDTDLDNKGTTFVKPPQPDGQEIIFLDGTKTIRKLGMPVTVTMGEQKISVRPGSYFFLNLIDETIQEYLKEVYPYREKLQALAEKQSKTTVTDIIKKVVATPKPEESQELQNQVGEIMADSAMQLFIESNEMQNKVRRLSHQTRYKIAQMILFDAISHKGKWKEEMRAPYDEEIESAIPMQRLKFEFTDEDVKNLIHVYCQINFVDTEKKDFLNLRMAM